MKILAIASSLAQAAAFRRVELQRRELCRRRVKLTPAWHPNLTVAFL